MRKQFLAAIVLSLLAVSAYAQEANRDDILAADVLRTMQRHLYYTMFDYVEFAVEDGVVTLSGFTTHPFKSRQYVRSLESLEGVSRVDNNIKVFSPSSYDEQIRRIIANRIAYQDGLLRYAMERYPAPFHILVSNGHVTLIGEVSSMLDKRMIEMSARDVIGVVSVTNKLRISSS